MHCEGAHAGGLSVSDVTGHGTKPNPTLHCGADTRGKSKAVMIMPSATQHDVSDFPIPVSHRRANSELWPERNGMRIEHRDQCRLCECDVDTIKTGRSFEGILIHKCSKKLRQPLLHSNPSEIQDPRKSSKMHALSTITAAMGCIALARGAAFPQIGTISPPAQPNRGYCAGGANDDASV